jgi:hypothetical protein
MADTGGAHRGLADGSASPPGGAVPARPGGSVGDGGVQGVTIEAAPDGGRLDGDEPGGGEAMAQSGDGLGGGRSDDDQIGILAVAALGDGPGRSELGVEGGGLAAVEGVHHGGDLPVGIVDRVGVSGDGGGGHE